MKLPLVRTLRLLLCFATPISLLSGVEIWKPLTVETVTSVQQQHGKLALSTISLEHDRDRQVSVKLGDTILPATMKRTGKRVLITLANPVEIAAGEKLLVALF